MSQRDVGDFSVEATRRDMEAVVGALGLDSLIVFGAGVGGLRAIDFTANHPEIVAALILYETFPRMEDAFPRELLQIFLPIARLKWGIGTRVLTNVATGSRNPVHQEKWKEMIDQSVTGDTVARLIETQMNLDVTDQLERIECPTLVCHSREGLEWPFALSERLAAGIAGSRLVALDGSSGGAFADADQAVEAIQSFLRALSSPDLRDGGDPFAASLTPRETEVLGLIARGLTSKEISQQLSLSVRTVGRHITNIYGKLGVRTRAEATTYAVRQGLVKE
jgi:DNA-binding CsgD family transcriptional regulator/pimeloyl-ACP methyl ester carboxylesterase